MMYYYTSLWKSTDADTFIFNGIIAANVNDIGVYFPDSLEDEQEWSELLHHEELTKSFSSMQILNDIANSGNGYTEEFSDIREIYAASLEEALHLAYRATIEKHGRKMTLYSNVSRGDSGVLSNPIEDIFDNKSIQQPSQSVSRALSDPLENILKDSFPPKTVEIREIDETEGVEVESADQTASARFPSRQ